MTSTTLTRRWAYTGNGVTTSFQYTNIVYEADDLLVYVNGVLQTLTTHYSVTGIGAGGGGNVVFVAAPADQVKILIIRDIDPTQQVTLKPAGAFSAAIIERALDRAINILQDFFGKFQRVVRLSAKDFTGQSLELPLPAAGESWRWNATEDGIESYTPGGGSGSGEANTASNVGGGAGVFKQKAGVDLEFKTLISGTNALVAAVNTNDITLTIATVAAGGNAGLMTGADKTKLNGIATGANAYVHPNHTGDVTSAGDGATTIANDAVTNAKLANMAQDRLKGRVTAGTGDPEDLTAAQVKTMLGLTDELIQDLVGAMFIGNTETGIAVTYQDADGTMDLAVDVVSVHGRSGAVVAVAGDYDGLALDLQDAELTRPKVKDFSETIQTFTGSGTKTINLQNGNVARLHSLTGAITLAFSNWPASGSHGQCKVYVEQGVTPQDINFPGAVRWGSPGVPTVNTASKTFILVFSTTDGGTTPYGMLAGDAF